MDPQLLSLSEQFEGKLREVDLHADEETAKWAYKFLTRLVERIEAVHPRIAIREEQKKMEQLLDSMRRNFGRFDERDSLYKLNDELNDDLDTSGVTAKLKP